MKICFLTHNLKQDNGAGVFSLRLVNGLRKSLGCEVVVLTTEPSGFSFEKSILYPKKIKLISQFFNIRKIIKECDIIHALDAFPYGLIAILCSFRLGKRIIITAVGSGSIIPLYQRFYSALTKYCYRKADRLTAISQFTKTEILKKVKNLEIQVINHGVDFEEFSKLSEKGKTEELSKYRPYILSVGALRWRKGHHFSIQAFAKISQVFPDLKYLIVGKKQAQKYYDKLLKLVKDLNLEGKVFILNNIESQEKLIQIYQGAELFCLMSQNVGHDVEGFGLVFLEAAACGLPVVGSEDCGVEDAVQDGKNGFLVNSRSIDDFADAIIKILQDRQLKEKMQANSLALARASDWKIKIEEYVKIYKELLKNKK